jgi:hypothetical protein
MAMKKTLSFLFGVIVSFFVIGFFMFYNLVQYYDEAAKKSWAQLYGAYQKQTELALLLAGVSSAYSFQNKDLSVNALELKSLISCMDLKKTSDQNVLNKLLLKQRDLSWSLSRLYTLASKQYSLKNDESFRSLQKELLELEGQIFRLKKEYSEKVFAYNFSLRFFPFNIPMKYLGYRVRDQILCL